MKNHLSKFIIIGILILVVVVVLFMKNRNTPEIKVKESVFEEVQDTPTSETLLEETVNNHQISESEKRDGTESKVETIRQKPKKIDKDALAVVNDFRITKDYLEERYQSLPPQYKSEFRNDKEGLLDQLIVWELLYREAERRGFGKSSNMTDIVQQQDAAIQELIKDIAEKIHMSDGEMERFYHDHKSEMRGAGFEQVKPSIKNYLIQQKQGEAVNQLIGDLREKADIIMNEEWLEIQRALKPPNPLTEALKTGNPTVLDLGAGTCIPCKMMKPIFSELEEEYRGRANIIILEVSEHRDLARKYQIRVIPTQIFIDKYGNVYWRHEGFLSKDAIIKKLNEMGV